MLEASNIQDQITLPVALQLCLDDVAWHNGYDERSVGRPSRSGLPRKHAAEDYVVINELGKAIDMKILCPLCLGEWDKDNLLRGEVGITFDPNNWDRASKIDYPLAEKCKETAEACEYLEYAVHGLMHGCYDENGKQLGEQEYFAPKERGGRRYPISMADLKRRLDLFRKIYDFWGFQKTIRTFVSPGGVPPHMPLEAFAEFAQELNSRGYKYWTNGWPQLDDGGYLLNDVIIIKDICHGEAPWNAYDFDPGILSDCNTAWEKKRSVYGMHWANFLRFNPARNMELLPDWIAFFKRQAEIFGIMLSKDIAFAANQLLYSKYAKLQATDGKCIIDLTDVVKLPFSQRKNEFYISLQKDLIPKSCIGGSMALYETHIDFCTYKISHTEDVIQLLF